MNWKAIGKAIAWPVTRPVQMAKEKAMVSVIAAIVRHVLTAAGGAGLVVSDNDVEQVAAGLATLIGIIWSIVEKRSRPATP